MAQARRQPTIRGSATTGSASSCPAGPRPGGRRWSRCSRMPARWRCGVKRRSSRHCAAWCVAWLARWSLCCHAAAMCTTTGSRRPTSSGTCIPWFDHMIHSPLHPALRDRRRAALHGRRARCRSSGGEPDWSAEWTPGAATTRRRARGIRTRTRRATAALAPRARRARASRATWTRAGDTLYQTYCAVCHGGAGDGERAGRSARSGRRRCSPARARGYSDGYIYSIIRYGRGRHAPVRRQGLPAPASLGHRQPPAQAAGASPAPQEPAGAAAASHRRRAPTGSTCARPR